ncbi:MAG: EAL domain-containing protein [Acidimicrobiia bacterium]|jgi:diguanylate cyclase (GGDEF)-like protein/PAS domain S-box-containing protein
MQDLDLGDAVAVAAVERFRMLVQRSPDMVSIYDLEGRFAFVSSAHTRILGWAPEELVGRFPLDFVHPDDADAVAIEFAAQLGGERPPVPVELRFRGRDGRYRFVEAAVVDLTAEPSVGGILVASRDVSDRKSAEAVVLEQSRVLERVARGAPLAETLDDLCAMVERWVDGALAVALVRHGDGLRVAAAPSLSPELWTVLDRVSGQPHIRTRLLEGPVVGSVASIPPRPEADVVLSAAGLHGWWAAPIYASDGENILGTLTALLPDEREPTPMEHQLLATVGSLAAIALERDAAQDRLAYQASHDALTDLPNREHLVARLRAIAEYPSDRLAAVFFLDLDRFKVFNDSSGHEVGDRILVDVSRRLRSALRPGDAVARFGGDEFVVVCVGLATVDEVMAVARRMLDVVAQPIEIDGMEIVVTASIGVALADGQSPEALLRDADTAMYRAKERGRGRAELFDGALRARVVARLDVERDLRRALDAGELTLHYQPVMSLRTGRFSGFESLVRWNHPTRGLLVPDQFLEVAEDAGLIGRIGTLVRDMAFRQWVEWHTAHPEWGDFLVGVNLAAAELRDISLPAQIAALIEETGADASSLCVEVSERVLASDTEVARAVLGELRDLGLLVVLDDFGTGSSPLLHLRRFPIHAVKLDGALIRGIGVVRDDAVLASGVIELAHRLGLFVVAEGVEDEDQMERLRSYGCLLAQGHLFAPAMPVAEAEAWIAARGLSSDEETAEWAAAHGSSGASPGPFTR